MLGNRYQFEQFRNEFTHSNTSFFLEDYPPDLKTDFVSAREVWIIGVRLTRTIRSNYVLIEEKLQQGHHVKVLLVHPEGSAIEMAVSRNYARTGRDADRESKNIKTTLQLLCELHQNAPDNLEIRTIQNPLTFGAIGVNRESTSGILYSHGRYDIHSRKLMQMCRPRKFSK